MNLQNRILKKDMRRMKKVSFTDSQERRGREKKVMIHKSLFFFSFWYFLDIMRSPSVTGLLALYIVLVCREAKG